MIIKFHAHAEQFANGRQGHFRGVREYTDGVVISDGKDTLAWQRGGMIMIPSGGRVVIRERAGDSESEIPLLVISRPDRDL